jgi:hypothetical protein
MDVLIKHLGLPKKIEDPSPIEQNLLFNHSIIFKIQNFMKIFRTKLSSPTFFEKLTWIYKYYMKDNLNAHSLTTQFSYFSFFQLLFEIFPLQVSETLLNVYSDFPKVFVTYEDPVFTLEDCLKKYEETTTEKSLENYKVINNMLDLLNLYNDESHNRLMLVLSENDMEIGIFFKDYNKHWTDVEALGSLLKKETELSQLESMKLSTIMSKRIYKYIIIIKN